MNKQGFLNALLLGLLLAVLALLAALHTNPAKRNDYWLKGMDESPAPADYSVNPHFRNGQTLQSPPEGTLPQGWKPYHFQDGVEGALAAGKALRNPYPASDKAALERGFQVYMRTCLPCHGTYGRGDGKASLNKREGGYPGVANLLSEHTRGVSDGYIYNYIARGGVIMPSYGAQVEPEDRWKVVSWVRHLQKTHAEGAPAEGSPQAAAEAAHELQEWARTTPGATPSPQTSPTASKAKPEIAAPAKAAPAEPKPAATPAAAPAAAPAAKPAVSAAAAPKPAAAAPAPQVAAVKAGPVSWAEAQAVMKKYDCLACHAADRKLVGPSYKDVAKRYAGKPGAVEQLVKKVKMGGAGNWGQVPMTAHPSASDADLTTMVKGILSLAGGQSALPSLKQALALAHGGQPMNCPAMADPAYLARGGAQRGAQVALAPRTLSEEEAHP